MRSHPVVSRRPSGTLLLWLTCALIVGASLGRLAFFTPRAPVIAPPPPADTPAAAVSSLEQRVQSNPNDVRALQSLGVAYVRTAAQTADPSYYDLAQRAFDRADVVQPDLDDTRLGRSVLALSRHEFAAALDLGERVHASNPDDPDALAAIVDAQVELGHYDEAAAALQELLDRRPGLPAYSRLSYLRELRGDTPGALRAMREADTAATGSVFDRATVAAFLGDLEFGRGHLDDAEVEYRRALRQQPDLALAVVGVARIEAARGDRATAVAQLRKLTDRIPVPSAVTLLGDLQEQQGRAAAAAKSFGVVRTIGRLQQASGQVTDLEMAIFEADHATDASTAATAVERARRAYEARPGNVFVNDALAWSLFRSGDVAGALPFVDRALRLGTPDALLHYHAAVIADAAGQTDRARTEIRLALERNPWFSFRYHGDAVERAQRLGVDVSGSAP